MPTWFLFIIAMLGTAAMTAAAVLTFTGESAAIAAISAASILVFIAGLAIGRD